MVRRIEEGMDRRGVECTTYQMRNCFRQFGDGVASELDVHCYFQHASAADLMTRGGSVLDVCCGRGLLIPFLRYRGKPPGVYVGVDIRPDNARWKDGADPRREDRPAPAWGFPTRFVEANVARMAGPVRAVHPHPFDLIVYTSSIEHMQPEAQRMSLMECGALAAGRTLLYLTCPVTRAGEDGYRCRYRAHVYEPSLAELGEWLALAGWKVRRQLGLCTSTTLYRRVLGGKDLAGAEHLYATMPRELALPTIAALYPRAAGEVALVCGRT